MVVTLWLRLVGLVLPVGQERLRRVLALPIRGSSLLWIALSPLMAGRRPSLQGPQLTWPCRAADRRPLAPPIPIGAPPAAAEMLGSARTAATTAEVPKSPTPATGGRSGL